MLKKKRLKINTKNIFLAFILSLFFKSLIFFKKGKAKKKKKNITH